MATKLGAHNTIPSFVALNGPVREARFINQRDGTPDGGVHDLFVITGRVDAPGCRIAQENFDNLANISFRIPSPVFGVGPYAEASITFANILMWTLGGSEPRDCRGAHGKPS